MLTIAYTGSLYRGKSDAAPLCALNELASNGQIDKEYVRFAYGRSSAIFQQEAERYTMRTAIIDHGLVSRPEALKIQARSHILFLASWNSSGQEDSHRKLMEYMMMGKPLIAVVSGTRPEVKCGPLSSAAI